MSLRYSIYKVQTCSQLLAEACLSYHTQFHLSRTFFKFFQISLSGFDSVFAVTSRRPEYLSTSFSICQELFSSFFKKFFQLLSSNLIKITYLNKTVKHFFEFLQILFSHLPPQRLPQQTALVEYQTIQYLSMPFSHFPKLFY